MIKYKIGTEFLDQFDSNSSFAITKAVSKIGEINLRHGDRSTGFKVPLTAKNTKLLNYVTIINSSTSNQSFQRIQGKLVEDDVVISDGYFQVTKFNPYKKEVDMRFYGGNTDWFSELKDRKINESYPNYQINDLIDIVFSSQNIIDTFDTELNEANPYKFFLVDNNKDTTRNNTNDVALFTFVDDYQIGFSQGVLVDRIFKSVGITTNGNVFQDPKYYNTLVSGSKALSESRLDEFNSDDYKQSVGIVNRVKTTGVGTGVSEITFDLGNPIAEYNGRSITLQNDCSGLYINLELQAECEINPVGTLSISVLVNGTSVYSGTSTDSTPINPTGTIGYYFFSQEIDLPSLNGGSGLSAGDIIVIDYSCTLPESRTIFSNYSNIFNSEPFFFFSLDNYIKLDEANELLPNISQSDFIKDFLTQFGAITQYNVKTKTLTCNKFNIIDDNKRNAINWSNKVDLSVVPNVNLTKILSNYGKRSFFKYSENDDSDYLNSLYKAITNYQLGDGIIDIDNGFLTDEKDIYTSPYSPTVMAKTFPLSDPTGANYDIGNLYLPFVPIYTRTSVTDIESNDLNPRKYIYLDNIVLSDAYKGNITSISLFDGVSAVSYTSHPLVYFDKDDYSDDKEGFSSSIDNYTESLNFGPLNSLTANTYEYGNTKLEKQTLLNQYYSFQKSVLNKPIYLEINLMLTSLDVQNVDFFTPIFLNFGLDSGYYYIDEISQYKGQDKSTKVKLVKI